LSSKGAANAYAATSVSQLIQAMLTFNSVTGAADTTPTLQGLPPPVTPTLVAASQAH